MSEFHFVAGGSPALKQGIPQLETNTNVLVTPVQNARDLYNTRPFRMTEAELSPIFSLASKKSDGQLKLEALPVADLLIRERRGGALSPMATLAVDSVALPQMDVSPDIYSHLLQRCINEENLLFGRQIHCLIVESGLESDMLVMGHLIRMFAFFDSLTEAKQTFSKMSTPTSFAWNSLILVHANSGQNEEAIKLFDLMQQSDVEVSGHVLVTVLKACSRIAVLKMGWHIHQQIVECGFELEAFVGSALMDMYIACGRLEDAQIVLENSTEQSAPTWNALIAGHVDCGESWRALLISEQMQQTGLEPNRVTFVCMLKACGSIANLEKGRRIHTQIIEKGLESSAYIGNSLINMYGKCRNLHDAHMMFCRLCNHDVITWNTLIAGYTYEGHGYIALQLFQQMEEVGVKPNQVTYISILNACSSVGALNQGKQVHDSIVKYGFCVISVIGNALIDMYAKCGSLMDAYLMFETLPQCDVVTWSTLITGYAQHGFHQETLQFLSQMRMEGLQPNQVTFGCLLTGCFTVEQVRQIHAQILEHGVEVDTHLGNSLIDMYCKCGSLHDGYVVFDRLLSRDVVTFTALMAGYVQHGCAGAALVLFNQMQSKGLQPDQVAYACALKACLMAGALEQGRHIHSKIIHFGFESDDVIVSTLLDLYASCASINEAHKTFKALSRQEVVTWSALIAGYVQHEDGWGALHAFEQMLCADVKPNSVTFANALKACARMALVEVGMLIHSWILECSFESDVYIGCTLVDLYSECGSFTDLLNVFDNLPDRNVVTWNAFFSGYSQHANAQELLFCFEQMILEGVAPDAATFISILKSLPSEATHEQARLIHSHVVKRGFEMDISVGNFVISMYAKCGSLQDACLEFDKLPKTDITSWNALLAGYCQHQKGDKCMKLFGEMQAAGIHPNCATFSFALNACTMIADFEQGLQIHHDLSLRGFDSDLAVINALLHMYVECGNVREAHMVFEAVQVRDAVTWNLLMAGYCEQGQSQVTLDLFKQMEVGDTKSNWATFVICLKACSAVAALEHGRKMHIHIIESGLEKDAFVGSSLIDMYAKCGNLDDGQVVFQKLPKHDVVTWGTIISGFVEQDACLQAFQLFECMQKAGYRPDEVTFLSVLSACRREGLVKEGCSYLKLMTEGWSITPGIDHYNSMVDILGHSNHLSEAEDLLEILPFPANVMGWTSLLSSCRTKPVVSLGRRCFDLILAKDKANAAAYVLMENIYMCAGMQADAEKLEVLRNYANAWKKPGKAFIEVDGDVHSFVVRDKIHPYIDDIHAKLKLLSMQIKERGYKPHLNLVVNTLSNEEKEDALCGHSEKLALAFGLICMPQGTTIRIAKNLRMCADCHSAIRLVSKVEMKEIIVKDVYRVHRFWDGACTCKDYI